MLQNCAWKRLALSVRKHPVYVSSGTVDGVALLGARPFAGKVMTFEKRYVKLDLVEMGP